MSGCPRRCCPLDVAVLARHHTCEPHPHHHLPAVVRARHIRARGTRSTVTLVNFGGGPERGHWTCLSAKLATRAMRSNKLSRQPLRHSQVQCGVSVPPLCPPSALPLLTPLELEAAGLHQARPGLLAEREKVPLVDRGCAGRRRQLHPRQWVRRRLSRRPFPGTHPTRRPNL